MKGTAYLSVISRTLKRNKNSEIILTKELKKFFTSAIYLLRVVANEKQIISFGESEVLQYFLTC